MLQNKMEFLKMADINGFVSKNETRQRRLEHMSHYAQKNLFI
jgi:hypothetical protein